MPIFSGNALGVGVGMDGKDLGMPFRTRCVWVNVQLAETAPERLVAFHVKRLIAKEQTTFGYTSQPTWLKIFYTRRLVPRPRGQERDRAYPFTNSADGLFQP